VKAKVGPQSSAKELWAKLQDSYSRKTSMNVDQRNEEDRKEEKPRKGAASNKPYEDHPRSKSHATSLERAPCKYPYDRAYISSYTNESCGPPDISESESYEGMEDSEDEEVVVNLEAELISALDELRKERRKNEQLKRDLLVCEEILNQKEDVDTLKMQLEEAMKIEQIFMSQLKEKDVEIMSLKEELERMSKDATNSGKEVEENLSEFEKENQSLKDQLQKTQEGIKEAGEIMDEQKTQLQKREEEVERLKDEVVGLKEDMQRLQTQQKHMTSSERVLQS
jgi:DNA repair exonuclease SbcCD ATPase subunit